MSPSAYFLPAGHSIMQEHAIIIALRRLCRVLARGTMLEPPGVTLITEDSIDHKVQERLGLVPLEKL